MDPEILASCISFYNIDKDIFMSIGANIGTTSIGPCLATNSRLICVEASKKNASLLNKNLYKNRIKAWSLNCAVTSKKNQMKIAFWNYIYLLVILVLVHLTPNIPNHMLQLLSKLKMSMLQQLIIALLFAI